MSEYVDIRTGQYRDSVALMQVSRAASTLDGVNAALVAMATPLNLELLSGMGFPEPSAGPNDLLIAVRAVDDAVLNDALAAVDEALTARPAPSAGTDGSLPPARTVGQAFAAAPDATLALISVPGASALPEAWDALAAGRSVLIFSDNVPLADEIALKREGNRRGLLVMGPDCGTAIVGGVALGFANVVRRGTVGIVAASGTGAQQVSSLLDTAGIGISQLLGVGGRDLSADVGGLSTIQAMRALADDPGTDRILVLSKPPDPAVAEKIRALAGELGVPVHFGLIGPGQPDLTAVTEEVILATGAGVPAWPTLGAGRSSGQPGALRGLYSGGTLADEAMIIAAESLGRISSNIPLDPADLLPPDLRATGHVVIDFGADELTQGRAHPMIDPTLRLDRLAREAEDPDCAVVLMDVVLGHVADPDPAATAGPAIEHARKTAAGLGRELPVVVSLVGTEGDPQVWSGQADALAAAGAEVFASNAAAARRATALATGEGESR